MTCRVFERESKNRKTMSKDKATQTKIADYFETNQRAVSYWKRDGCKLDPFDTLEVCRWLRMNRRMKPDLKRRVVEIEKEHAIEQMPEKIETPKTVEDRKTLEQFRDYFAGQLNIATAANLADEVKHWTDLLHKAEKCIRESQAHERKLGLEQGETIQREEVERIMKAVIYAGNACVRNQLKEICQVLASESNPNAIYQKLAPATLGGRLFEGFKAVMKSPSKVQLPEWIVDVMQSEGENYLKGVDLK